MLAEDPLCRTVWIARPIQEVCASMKAAKMPFDEPTARSLIALRDEYKEHLDFVISYESLNTMSGCRALWEFVLPGVPFDVGRWGVFSGQRIAYTANNPPGPRQIDKFMGWFREEMSQWQSHLGKEG
jgi:hypothetical protein